MLDKKDGNKSLKIIKDRKVVEKGIRLNLKDFKSNIEIAEYINKKYKLSNINSSFNFLTIETIIMTIVVYHY